jgi:hypothetical protein
VSNCFIYAIRRWWSDGGHVGMRWSRHRSRLWPHFSWPHFVWTEDFETFWEYVPPVHYPVVFPPPLFRGIVRKLTREEAIKGKA